MTAATFDAAKAPSNAALAAIRRLAALTAIRLLLAAHLELHFDEAYYWYWSKNLQLSYFDHPPAVAWFISAGTALFGDTELGVRIFGQLSVHGHDLPAFRCGEARVFARYRPDRRRSARRRHCCWAPAASS